MGTEAMKYHILRKLQPRLDDIQKLRAEIFPQLLQGRAHDSRQWQSSADPEKMHLVEDFKNFGTAKSSSIAKQMHMTKDTVAGHYEALFDILSEKFDKPFDLHDIHDPRRLQAATDCAYSVCHDGSDNYAVETPCAAGVDVNNPINCNPMCGCYTSLMDCISLQGGNPMYMFKCLMGSPSALMDMMTSMFSET